MQKGHKWPNKCSSFKKGVERVGGTHPVSLSRSTWLAPGQRCPGWDWFRRRLNPPTDCVQQNTTEQHRDRTNARSSDRDCAVQKHTLYQKQHTNAFCKCKAQDPEKSSGVTARLSTRFRFQCPKILPTGRGEAGCHSRQDEHFTHEGEVCCESF